MSEKKVAVIGAGVSGVLAAAHLLKEGVDVTVFERNGAAGGIWLYDERKPLEPEYPAAPASRAATAYTDSGESEDERLRLMHAPPGPCYAGMKNIIVTRLLETTLLAYPQGTPDTVSHSKMNEYIQDIAVETGVQGVTRYDTSVKNLVKEGGKWVLESETLTESEDGIVKLTKNISTFDSVVIASGHYHAPKLPPTPGLADWKRRWPNRVTHSKRYRRAEDFTLPSGQKQNFLLVGGSASAGDIAKELIPHAENVYQVQRESKWRLPLSLFPKEMFRVGEVASYDAPVTNSEDSNNHSNLEDGVPIPATITLKDGRKLCNIHHVILCTGYTISLPFLPQFHADSTSANHADNKVIVTDGTQFHNLHKDIFYIPDPSLAFIGVPVFTATFTLFEFQAMCVARVLAGKASVPSDEVMRKEYQEKVKRMGHGRDFHSLFDREEEYVGELLDWVNADVEREERLQGHTEGWKTAREDLKEFAKKVFGEKGSEGRRVELVC